MHTRMETGLLRNWMWHQQILRLELRTQKQRQAGRYPEQRFIHGDAI